MKVTKKSIAIEINPERHYAGQFVGTEYYRLSEVVGVFGKHDYASMQGDAFDIGENATNEEMIRFHLDPFRRSGYICE